MNIRQYLGIPYKYHGRDINEGVDCYGLITNFYRREFNIDLPDLPYRKDVKLGDEFSSVESNFNKIGWNSADKLNIYDVIVFRNMRFIGQVALYLYNNKILHTARRTGSVLHDLSKERKRRIIGIYRWL